MKVLTCAVESELADLRRRDEFFWLDLQDPVNSDLDVLGSQLGLHPLALEDSHEWHQRPKFETYEGYVFVVFYTVSAAAVPGHRSVEVHLYVSGDFVVTIRRRRSEQMDALHVALDSPPDSAEEYLVYRIFDGLTDAYFPLLAATEAQVDALEERVLDRPRHEHLQEIYRLKQEIHQFERQAQAQKDYFLPAVDAIAAVPGFTHGNRLYLRDVGDHLAHVADELRRQSADLAALTATFYNANTNKLNQIATRLSVVATFFVVATTVTGFFGQNFGWLVRNIGTRSDFLIFGVGGLVAPVGLLSLYFWKRRDDWM